MKWLIVLCTCISTVGFSQALRVDHYGSNPSRELSELWKIQIAGDQTSNLKDVWLKAQVKQGSQSIFEASTDPIELSEGLNVLDQFKIQVARQRFSEMALEAYVTSTGKLPAGAYTGCVTVFQGQTELKTLCIEIIAENYSPPMLIYPFNGQELSNTSPVLSWLAPVPNAIDGISYSVKLVEQLQGQTPQEALLRNAAKMQIDKVVGTSMPYPSDALSLEIGNTYAWQVEAYVGPVSVGITQVWSFTVKELSSLLKQQIRNQDYIELSNKLSPNPVAVIQKVNVKFVELQARSKFTITVFTENGEELKGKIKALKNGNGDNYHSVDLSKLKGMKHEALYAVVFTDQESGARYRLNLQYLDPDKL